METKSDNSQLDATQSMSCCSAFYEQDWVRHLAEDCFHPGGADLTHRTVAAMSLQAGAELLDLGCGSGKSAIELARSGTYALSAVDISAANIDRAKCRSDSKAIKFVLADAHELPFEQNYFDGVLAECVVSLFGDQRRVLAEVRRVLKPGGQLGITDMAIDGMLPRDIVEFAAPWTCLVDAVDQVHYTKMFSDAGFRVTAVVDESECLMFLLRSLKRKLLLIGAANLAAEFAPFDLATVRYRLDRFAQEVRGGSIRYLRFQMQA